MTTESTTETIPPRVVGEDRFARPDAVLQDLSDLSRMMGISVTLYLPFGAASGTIISANEYFKWIADRTRASEDDPEYAKAVDAYARTFDIWAERTQTPNEDEGFNTYDIRFIHLKNARCFAAGPASPHELEYLRVQLSHVSAWSYGAFRVD